MTAREQAIEKALRGALNALSEFEDETGDTKRFASVFTEARTALDMDDDGEDLVTCDGCGDEIEDGKERYDSEGSRLCSECWACLEYEEPCADDEEPATLGGES